jgi:salicylate hydroxylase
MDQATLTIAGAGIAGLAAALAVGTRDVLMLEQAQAFSETGASLQLGPNAIRALQKLGAWDAVAPLILRPREIHLRDALSGKLLNRLRLGASFEKRFGAPYCVARRADLHAALHSCVLARRNIRIRLDARVIDVKNTGDQVQLNLGDQTECTTYVIAADGAKSCIRENLFPQSRLCNSGEVYHRAQSGATQVAGIETDCVNIWMHPKGHVVQYPAGHGADLNVVAITPEGQEPLQFYEAAARVLQEVLQANRTPYTQWPAFYVEPLASWIDGNIMLLGDAAHATLPYLAQGAAMSLEDAAALQIAFANTQTIADAFNHTQNLRLARTRKLHVASLAAGKIYHYGGMMRTARNLALLAAPHSLLIHRMAWIYEG